MRLYVLVATGALRRYATYRVATVAGLFTNIVFGLIIAYTYVALWHLRPHLGAYTLPQAVTYVWVGQGLLAAMSIRSQLTYRVSFAVTAFGNFAATGLDFVTILLMFTQVDALGGFSLPEVAFLYGASATGSVDRVGARVRDGTLDVLLLLRPAPVLAQVAADRFALRRVGRVVRRGAVLGYALGAADIDWDVARVGTQWALRRRRRVAAEQRAQVHR